jgi:uncharacterized protein YjbI with pentapeptide repeats
LEEGTEGQRVVPAKEILDKIQKREPVEYDNVIIEGDLDLSKLDLPTKHIKLTEYQKLLSRSNLVKIVPHQIDIRNSSIRGELNFSNILFQEDIHFIKVQVSGKADFSGAQFEDAAVFTKVQFDSDAGFSEAQMGFARFMSAKFGGHAGFSGAQFTIYADFSGAQFSKKAGFWCAQFSGVTSFIAAQFSGYAEFSQAQFDGEVNFLQAQFSGDADFQGAQFNAGLNLKLVKYERFLTRWESIKDHLEYDGAAYLSLIKNFRNLEQFEDADACYYQYRNLSQSRKDWYKGPNRLIDLLILIHNKIISYLQWIMDFYAWLNKVPPLIWIHKFNWSKLGDHLSWISCGYGLKIWPMVVWITATILIFAWAYYTHGGIARDTGNTSLIDSLYFSTFALAGRTPLDNIHPNGPWMYVVLLENLIGYVFLALFVVVLGRKVVR